MREDRGQGSNRESGQGVTGRRGRCLADTDLIRSCPRPVVGKGVFAWSIAARNKRLTAGLLSTATLVSGMNRPLVPLPRKRWCGSGRLAPYMK